MLIEQQKRLARVRFRHPIRVVTLGGEPRVIRTLTGNVSREGLFLRMPEPLPLGTRVALSLEAGGRALALAQAEVVWGGSTGLVLGPEGPGCGVRFTQFMHPRAEELVKYLVQNLGRGKPLMLAPPERAWMRWLPRAGIGALVGCAALAAFVLWPTSVEVEEPDDAVAEVAAEVPAEVPAEVRAEVLAEPTGATPEVTASLSPAGERVGERASGPLVEQPLVAAPEIAAAPAVEQGVVAAEIAPEPSPEPIPVAAEVAPSEPAPPPVERRVVAAEIALNLPAPAPKVAALTPIAAPTAKKSTPKKLVANSQRGTIKLPSGAAASLTWTVVGSELRLVPQLPQGAQLTKAFLLTGPARAVFDVSGAAPTRSHVVPASPPYATGVRLGKSGAGTRIVVDLDSAPKQTRQDGDALVLLF